MEMYCTDHYGSEEYPFHGIFYKVEIDDSKPLDGQVDEEIPIFETDMDMSDGGTLSTDTFRVYFPFKSGKEPISIKEGDLFKGVIYGMEQRGRVIGVYPTQLDGCTVLLKRI